MQRTTIYVKNTNEVSLPVRATPQSAGYDVVAVSEPKIVGKLYDESSNDGFYSSIDYIQYETGLYVAPQADNYQTLFHLDMRARSSVSKYNLILANGVGTIDYDYRGQILARFKYVFQPEDFEIYAEKSYSKILGKVNYNKIYKKGDAIVQLIPVEGIEVSFQFVDSLENTIRGEGGFGSTTVTK